MIYRTEIKAYGEFPDWDEQPRDVILVARDKDFNDDVAVRFYCPCEAQTKIYFQVAKQQTPDEWQIVWNEPDKVLSLSPSILIRGGCKCHFWIKNNQAV